MTLQQALQVIRKAGGKVLGLRKDVVLRRREIARINEILTGGGIAVVTHNGRRASVFTKQSYKGRVVAAKNARAKLSEPTAHAESAT